MTVPILAIVGIDLRACRYAVRLPLEQLNNSTSRTAVKCRLMGR
jgi:hypothetical protein